MDNEKLVEEIWWLMRQLDPPVGSRQAIRELAAYVPREKLVSLIVEYRNALGLEPSKNI